MSRLMTATDVAEYLGKSHKWVLRNQHTLPAFRVGRELRFRPEELAEWLETQRERPMLRSVR